jgi:hypothetical protein
VPALRELQRAFAAALFEGASEGVSAHVRRGGAQPAVRLDIYRQRLHATFRRTLALEFPVIERLVGEGYFARLARDYQQACPSRAGDLQRIGASFATFLAARFDGSAFDYLSHVARLEWAIEECLIAAEAAPLDPRALADIPADSYAKLRFRMHPACRLISSSYPVLAIWQANQSAHEPVELIDLESGSARALLRREAHGMHFQELGAAEFALLASLAADACLDAALEAAQEKEANFDPGPSLRRAVRLGMFTGATLGAIDPLEVQAREPGDD